LIKIRALKSSMNTLRTNFILPNYHKILITPYCLLGFIEGDGRLTTNSLFLLQKVFLLDLI
jgi:hypothetical protein